MSRELSEILSIPSRYMDVKAAFIIRKDGTQTPSRFLDVSSHPNVIGSISNLVSSLSWKEKALESFIIKDGSQHTVICSSINERYVLTLVVPSRIPIKPALELSEHVGLALSKAMDTRRERSEPIQSIAQM